MVGDSAGLGAKVCFCGTFRTPVVIREYVKFYNFLFSGTGWGSLGNPDTTTNQSIIDTCVARARVIMITMAMTTGAHD